MALEDAKTEIKKLTEAEFAHISSWVTGVETARRRDEKTASTAVASVVIGMQDAGTIPKPKAATAPPVTAADIANIPEWVDPGTDHSKMFRKDAVVKRNGKVYQSGVDGLNSWEPGGAGVYANIWKDVTPTGTSSGATEGTQANPIPFKAGLSLAKDQYVSYNGLTYKVLQAHTTQDGWNPPAAASLFQKV